MKRIVVTGATSFLGSTLVKKLLEDGHFVYAVVRPASANRKALPEEKENLVVIESELEKLDRIETMISSPCDYFFHFGWDGSGSENRKKQDVQQKNVEDSLKALTGAKNLGCRRFLFSGSQAEYGQCPDVMYEERECHPVSEYGKAKREFYERARSMCKKWNEEGVSGIGYIHTRIFSVYGFGDHPSSLVCTCLKTFSEGGYMELGACTQQWNYLYIDDLVEALIALMFSDAEIREDSLYNVAGRESQTMPLRNYVEKMHELCGGRGDYAYEKCVPNAEGLANLIPDTTRIYEDTGWVPKVSFEEGIRRMIGKMKETACIK